MGRSDDFISRGLNLIEFYRNNPVIAAEDLLGVELDTPQKVVLETIWKRPYTIVTAGRGTGKTFMLSVVSALYAMLYPGRRVLIMSPSFRQCVVGDTLVVTNSGLEFVKDLQSKPDFMLSSSGMQECSAMYKNLAEPTIGIETSRGFYIEGALDHNILCAGSDGEIRYKSLCECSEGDNVVIVVSNNVLYDRKSTQEFLHGSVAEPLYFLGNNITESDSNALVPNNILVNFIVAQLVFLQGLFDSLGDVYFCGENNSFNSVILVSSSKQLVRTVSMMLLNLGILCSIQENNSNNEITSYKLSISESRYIELFYKNIGFKLYSKQKKLETMVASLCVLYSASGSTKPYFVFDKIKTITNGFDYTYDFTIEEAHNYFSNGFISHNSKNCFGELKKRYEQSPILREACFKKPVVGSDQCYLDIRGTDGFSGSSIQAYPLGSGDKIRGLRGHVILVDEFAQVPEDIFDMVIRPMGATTTSPMENVRRLKSLKEKIKSGFFTQEEYEAEKAGMQTNKIVGVTSAYFQFNHVYKRIQKYREEIEAGSDKYGLCHISYEDMSEGFLEQNNVMEAKATMSNIEFSLEYRGIWESDSDGVFKASLIEKCKSRTSSIRLVGEPGRRYILGIDPARSSDAFALVVIEVGNPSAVVNAFQVTGEKFPIMAQVIYEFCEKFDTIIMMMDAGSGGGGVAIKDILSSEHFSKGRLILDMDDEDHKKLSGRRILRMHDPKPNSIADANYATLNLLEQGMLVFPYQPFDGDDSKEGVYSNIKEMLRQTMLITVTPTKGGIAHFDIPSTGRSGRKKDLYSAFILASKALYDTVIAREEETSYINQCGLVIPVNRAHSAPVISSAMQVPGRR